MGSNDFRERTKLLLGETKLEKLKSSHVLIVGLGGVGAYTAEMICRAGVGRMTIIDCDDISISNINRQLIALHSTVGKSKTEVLAERLKDINSNIKLTIIREFLGEDNVDSILDSTKFDYVVDAIDTLTPKAALVYGSLKRGYPLVSSMGSGGKTDPTKVEITDISNSHHCRLAFALRKRLHRKDIRTGFWCVFSPEEIREGAMVLVYEDNKKSNVGTLSYMPTVFGCHCASVVIRGLIGEM
ncbi:MAG: tRNA threonylcarbamoyladenosine dehydratase [Bacteroidetes bacterium]|nr:tRNA threonylcarbamoyladenosine dehydratase [Bacteroidota bacterium]